MDKPTTSTLEYHSYHNVREWIKHKYNRDIDDWYGMFENGHDESKEFADFWSRFICDSDITNGSVYYLYSETEEDKNVREWVREITKIIFDEFSPDRKPIIFVLNW